MINRDLFVAPMRNCSHVDHNDYDFYLYTSRRANGVAPEWSYKNQNSRENKFSSIASYASSSSDRLKMTEKWCEIQGKLDR